MTQQNPFLEATCSIREEYIEEAAQTPPARRPAPWVAAVAALVILAITALLWPSDSPSDPPLPLFVLYAYAQSGETLPLVTVGETMHLASAPSDLFPGKQTYTFTISFSDASGNPPDLTQIHWACMRGAQSLRPGEAYENIHIQWVEEPGLYGYRITGWCKNSDGFDLVIRDDNGIILYQKSVWITFEDTYSVKAHTSYAYEAGLSTEELMAKIFDPRQDYFHHTKFSSSYPVSYDWYRDGLGGFRELEQRSDAATLLLQQWLAEMEQAQPPFPFVSVDTSGLTGYLLAQDVYWDQLSPQQIAQIESYGLRRKFSSKVSNNQYHNSGEQYSLSTP